jgi:O-antigen/teichoic acid export membrane protein
LAKATAIGAAFVSVPLTIKYLGIERYGMWMTISSISAMLAFSDFGMGNGLLSKVACASGRDDREAAARAVTSALFMLSAVAALMLAAFAVSYRITPWSHVLNLQSALGKSEAGPAVAVFMLCFALNLPIGITQRIQMAYQETFQSNLWLSAGSLTSFIALLVAIHFRAGLPWLIAAFSGGPVVVGALNLFLQLRFVRPWLTPRLHYFDFDGSKELFNTGFLFLLISIGSSVVFYADNFIIAQLLGPSEVARYSVGVRLFTIVTLLPQMIFTPLWPAYSEAKARGDMAWIRATLKRTAFWGLGLSLSAGLLLLTMAPWFITRWTRGAVGLPFSLLLALFAAAVVFSASYPHGILLWGLNALKFSAISMALVSVSSVIVKIAIIPSVGVAGAAWGTASCYFLFALIPNVFYANHLLKQSLSEA